MKIFKNKCSIITDGATIDYNQLKKIIIENAVLKRQIDFVRTNLQEVGVSK